MYTSTTMDAASSKPKDTFTNSVAGLKPDIDEKKKYARFERVKRRNDDFIDFCICKFMELMAEKEWKWVNELVAHNPQFQVRN